MKILHATMRTMTAVVVSLTMLTVLTPTSLADDDTLYSLDFSTTSTPPPSTTTTTGMTAETSQAPQHHDDDGGDDREDPEIRFGNFFYVSFPWSVAKE